MVPLLSLGAKGEPSGRGFAFLRQPLGLKEGAQQLCRGLSFYPTDRQDTVIEPLQLEALTQRADPSELGIGGPINHARDPRVHDRAGAHDAGLERAIQLRPDETFGAHGLEGLSHRQHLGVCRGVLQLLDLIPGACQDSVLKHNDAAHGDFIALGGGDRFSQSDLHDAEIAFRRIVRWAKRE